MAWGLTPLGNIRSMTSEGAGDRLLVIAAAIAVTAGLVGAFVGLAASSFWYDEFWTVWIVGSGDGAAAVLGRALVDTHPPGYYLTLGAWGGLFGRTEAALRGFSAAAAVAAVLVFGLGTRSVYSRPARLVAMVVAVASTFWFEQSQYARPYGLVMLAGAIFLVLGLWLIERDRAGEPLAPGFAALAGLALAGVFIHFYMVFLGLAVLIALFPFCPRLRLPLALGGVALLVMAFGYVSLVMRPNTIFLVENSWIGRDLGWYLHESRTAAADSVSGIGGRGIVAVLAIAAVIGVFVAGAPLARSRSALGRRDQRLFPLLVPLFVLAGAVTSSALMAPNFTNRNILVTSPFLWAAVALLYDIGVARLGRWRPAATVVLAALAVLTMLRLPDRLAPRTSPYRESAAFIAGLPQCRGAAIPVLIDERAPMKPGEAERHAADSYGHYLRGHALRPVLIKPLLAGDVLPAPECGVVAWGVHHVAGFAGAEAIRVRLEAGLGRPVTTRAFKIGRDPNGWRAGFIFLADPPPPEP